MKGLLKGLPSRFYIDREGNRYLAVYSYYPDVFIEPLKNTTQVAHFNFSYQGYEQSFNVFLLSDKFRLDDQIRILGEFREPKENLFYIDSRNNVSAQILQGSNYQAILQLARLDIREYVRNPAKYPGKTKIEYVDKIRVENKARYLTMRQNHLTKGKQEFHADCLLDLNFDTSFGCVAEFIPQKNAKFEHGFFSNFYNNRGKCCEYCYARNQHKSFEKNLVNVNKPRLLEEMIDAFVIKTLNAQLVDEWLGKKEEREDELIIRFGKRTESGSEYTLDALIDVLETGIDASKEYAIKVRFVFPTKFLRYNKKISKLLKKTNSSLLYSIGFDKHETGACIHGCNNQWRLEQAALYKNAGVNSSLYLLTDITKEPSKREYDILRFAKESGLKVQLLSFRFPPNEKFAQSFGEPNLSSLHGQGHFFEKVVRGRDYERFGFFYVARRIHPKWEEFIGNNCGEIRMCHHNGQKTYCGRCFLNNRGLICKTEKSSVERKTSFRNKSRKIVNPNQLSVFRKTKIRK